MIDALLVFPPVGMDIAEGKPVGDLKQRVFAICTRDNRLPQGLLSIGNYMSKSYKVKVYDARFDLWRGGRWWINKAVSMSKSAQLVGVSLMTEAVQPTVDLIDAIKANDRDTPIVLGGAHPTLYPAQTCADKSVDFVVSGDGEEPMLKLADMMFAGESDWQLIPSLTWKGWDGSIKTNPMGRPVDINSLGPPDYSILENVENYLTKVPFSRPLDRVKGTDYNSSRGCPFNCHFCINSVVPQYRCWRGKDPKRVVEELSMLKSKWKIKYFWMEEESPFVDMKRSREMAEGMIEAGLDLEWYGNIRSDLAVNASMDDLAMLNRAGWSETCLGIESGSNRVLGLMNKGITAEQSIEAVKRLRRLGLFVGYFVMMYLPGETLDDREKTYAMLAELKKINPVSYTYGPTPYLPYPGSLLYREALKSGLTEPKSLRQWAGLRASIYDNPRGTPWVKDYSWKDWWMRVSHQGLMLSSWVFAKGLKRKVLG